MAADARRGAAPPAPPVLAWADGDAALANRRPPVLAWADGGAAESDRQTPGGEAPDAWTRGADKAGRAMAQGVPPFLARRETGEETATQKASDKGEGAAWSTSVFLGRLDKFMGTYTTVRAVRFRHDKRLGYLDKFLKVAVIGSMCLYAYFENSYMELERPIVETSLWLEYLTGQPPAAQPPYCKDADYYYSVTWAYRNFRCVRSPQESEVFSKSASGFYLTTMWAEQVFRRRERCRFDTANQTSALAPANHHHPPTCAGGEIELFDEEVGEQTSNYVLDVTTKKLFFNVRYSTSRGSDEVNMEELTLVDAKGERFKAGDRGVAAVDGGKVLSIPIDALIHMSVTDDERGASGGDLLDLLDTRNRNSGGFCLPGAKMTPKLNAEVLRLGLVDSVNARCPRYRNTGLSIALEMEISNLYGRRTESTLRAKLTSRGQWVSSHAYTTGHYVGENGVHYHRQRKPYGIRVTVVGSGRLGVTTVKSVVLTLTSYIALLGAMVVVFDFLCAKFMAGFRVGKFLEAVQDRDSGNMVVKTVKRSGNSLIIR